MAADWGGQMQQEEMEDAGGEDGVVKKGMGIDPRG